MCRHELGPPRQRFHPSWGPVFWDNGIQRGQLVIYGVFLQREAKVSERSRPRRAGFGQGVQGGGGWGEPGVPLLLPNNAWLQFQRPGDAPGDISPAGKVLEEATVSPLTEQTRFAAGSEQGQPWSRGSVPSLPPALFALPSRHSSGGSRMRNIPKMPRGQTRAWWEPDPISPEHGGGEQPHAGLCWRTPPAPSPAGLALTPGWL